MGRRKKESLPTLVAPIPPMKEKKHGTVEITARVLQSVCLGILALGVASGLGDYGKAISLPFSQLSITTSVFGLMGTVITEVIARMSRKW